MVRANTNSKVLPIVTPAPFNYDAFALRLIFGAGGSYLDGEDNDG
jgi:hypothetical protein